MSTAVREHAGPVAAAPTPVTAGPAVAVAPTGVAPGSRCGGVLEHLRRGRLGAAWVVATADRPVPLPGRADLERRLGASLGDVRVHAGPAARSLLEHLGADGATAGRTIVLKSSAPPRPIVAHEVTHALQASGDAVPTRLVEADDDAEHEADLAEQLISGRRWRQRLAPGSLALRRTRQRPVDAATADPARGSTDLDDQPITPVPEPSPPETPAPVRQDGPADRREAPDEPNPIGPEAETGEVAGPEAAGEPATEPEMVAAPEAERAAAVGGAAPAPAPDRRQELRQALDATQERWDDGATEADRHEVHRCPEHATTAGMHPFARGPPLPVPATTPGRPVEPTEPEAVPREAITRAGTAVDTEIARAPARAPPTDTAGLDADERAELGRQAAELDREVDAAVGREHPSTIDDETLELDGAADPALLEQAGDGATQAITRHEATATAGAQEDFGESVMAPWTDPTLDLDTGLDGLTVPSVDVDAIVDVDRLDLVATETNAGAVPIDDVVLVTSEQLAITQHHAEREQTARDAIDADLAASDREVERRCTRATAKKQQAVQRITSGVADRRGTWTDAVEGRVAERRTETDDLVRTRREHVERVQRDTNAEASGVVTEARRDADAQWRDTRQRARNKADEANDASWWSRGIDWLRSAIADLVDWIDGFVDRCRRAIDGLLDAAQAVAHGIIEAGRRAVTATIDGLHAGVDLIADHLPGELGELAREHRDDVHAFLDERQAEVDAWADELHQGVDETIEGLREDLHTALDDFQQGVHEAADAIDEILENGLMPWLRRMFPELAALVDTGLLDPIERASDALGDWLDGALEATGIRSVQRAVADIEAEQLCQPPTEEQQAEDCAALEAMLQSVLAAVDGLLASPTAQRVQAFLTEQRDESAAQQVDAASDFFAFVHLVAQPVYEWWQSVEPTVQHVLDELGDIATTIWRHIATALGIDPDLSPLEALRAGLQALWQAAADAVAPLVAGIKEAWDWVRNTSPLRPLFDVFASLPELWDSLTALAGQIASGAADWLARAADLLAGTILPIANRVTGALADAVLAVIAQVESWVNAIVGALDAIIVFQAAHVLVEALVGLVGALVTPVRTALVAFATCAFRVWRWLADSLRDLGTFLRTLLDVAVGISLALLTFPIGLVTFFAGNVWLHLIPECYKPPLINFLLDLAIRFVRFFPEPADFTLAIVYQGALNFLEGVRAAADALKVGAVNLFASIFAGNAEIAAGFLVGLAEGVWESTGGTIIFLLQAVAWILSLPFKLASWAIGMVNGTLPDDAGEPADGTPGVVRRAGAAPPVEDAAEPAGSEPASDELSTAEVTATTDAEPAERDEAPAEDVEGPVEEPAVDEPAADESPADAVPDAELQPPAGPEGASGLGAALERLVTEGLSREDVQQLFDGAKAALRGMVGRLARDAAGALLSALNTAGAGFAIGRTIGSIVGQIVVEVALAALTGGASAGVTAAKVAISGARVTAKFASVIAKIKKALEPILGLVRRLRGALGDIIRGVQRWFDDVLRWMKGLGRRARRPRRPGGRGPPGRGRRPDRRRRRSRDRRRRENDRRRLARVMAVLRPKIRRMAGDGVGRGRLLLRLAYWRVRYRLTVLTLTPDGRIVARINPQDSIKLAKLTSAEIGRLLRPVLADAQRAYLREVRLHAAREAETSGQPSRLAEARARAGRGERDVEAPGAPLTRGERQAFLSPDTPAGPPADPTRVLTPTPIRGTTSFADAGTLRLDPSGTGVEDLATTVIVMPRLRLGREVLGSVNDADLGEVLTKLSQVFHLSSAQLTQIIAAPRSRQRALIEQFSESLPPKQRRRFRGAIARQLVRLALRDDLEAARNPEVGAANAVARRLGIGGELSLREQFGRESGFSPGSVEDVASTDARRRRAALERAEEDIGRIFRRLETAVERSDVFASQAGFNPRPLVNAIQRFLFLKRNDVTDDTSPAALAAAEQLLLRELVAVLRLYD